MTEDVPNLQKLFLQLTARRSTSLKKLSTIASGSADDEIKEYLFFWEGYPAHDATWEPEDNLQNAQEKLEEYYGRIEDNAEFKGGRL